jgi:carbon monoxide dehydrogenase subunit G
MGFSVRRALGVCVSLAALCIAGPSRAAGGELSNAEIARLAAGQPVVREDKIERSGHRYIGGVSYVLINAAPEQVTGVLENVGIYRHILPRTRSLRQIAFSRQGDSVIELEQGNSLFHGKYTVRVRCEHAAPDSSSAVIRFWLDQSFSHDIDDASGFFRVEPMGEGTLLTYMVMVDLGSGVFARLFENKVRNVALSTPQLVKSYVEAHRPS